MNRKYLKTVMALILLSMIGLISIQIYWISFSYNIKEKYFNYQVNKALSETIKTLETQETIFEISNEVFQIAESKDSIVERSIRNFDQSQNKYKNDPHTIANRSSLIMSGGQTIQSDTNLHISTEVQEAKSIDVENAFLKIPSSDVKEILKNKVNNKTLFVEKIVNQILNYNEDILQRLSRIDVEKIISQNLKEHDINIPFEYAIKTNHERVFSSKPFKETSSKIFSKRLFPNNFFNDKHDLEIYLPGRTSFIVKTMLPIIIISVLLTFLIIGVVVFNFLVIVKQKKLGEIKNDFVNNLTHELKTPIATISLAGQMLSDKDIQATGSMVERYAGIITDESKRLTKQVEKVLQIAMIDKGELKLNNKKICLNEIIERLCIPFTLKVERFEGRLEMNLPDSKIWIYADELHIGNAINNLIDNALKYKLNIPIIQVTLSEEESKVKIEVRDNGIGMNKVEQIRIFEKFYRVEGGNVHNIKGFGLGLSYVKKIIDLYKGEIHVKSKPNNGSIFTILLPKPDFTKMNL